jgi:putative transposase
VPKSWPSSGGSTSCTPPARSTARAKHLHRNASAGVAAVLGLNRKLAAEHRVFPCLLRHITAGYANHIWGIDITYLRLLAGWMYLMAVLDWPQVPLRARLGAVRHARTALCPDLRPSRPGANSTGDLEQRPGQSFHQPTVYRVAAGRRGANTCTCSAGASVSMDSRGRARDTLRVFTERLWRTVKYEEVYLTEYANPREARQSLGRYFPFYNDERPHQALDYLTPAAVYFQSATV